jgi:alpha-beta hydrolase superfamily lysophospholipase
VPGPQFPVLTNGVLDRLIECRDFRFQPGDHPGHGGVGRRGVLARAAPHSTRDALSASRQIAQLAQGG